MAGAAIGFAATPELSETLAAWRQWLSGERRVSGHTLDAYLADTGAFLSFLSGHLGRLPGLEDLGETRLADFRSWLSERAGAGLAASSRARALAALRNLYRWLDRSGRLHNGGSADQVHVTVPLLSLALDLGRPAAELKTIGTGGLQELEKNTGSYAWLAIADPATRAGPLYSLSTNCV